MLVAALQRTGGNRRQARARLQRGGDRHGIHGGDGVDGFDPKRLRPVEEHCKGAGRAVGGDGEEGHACALLVATTGDQDCGEVLVLGSHSPSIANA